jgi:hypothetical protein
MTRRSEAGGRQAKARSGTPLKQKRAVGSAAHRSSPTQQIAGWLDKLGMSEYAQRFSENDIDASVLPS